MVLLGFVGLRTVIFLAAIPAAAAGVVSAGSGRNRPAQAALEAPAPRGAVAALRENGPLGRFFAGIAMYRHANW